MKVTPEQSKLLGSLISFGQIANTSDISGYAWVCRQLKFLDKDLLKAYKEWVLNDCPVTDQATQELHDAQVIMDDLNP